MSEREYARHVGLSRGGVCKAKLSGRVLLHADGSIDVAASDARMAAATDPSHSRRGARKTKAPTAKAKAKAKAKAETKAETKAEAVRSALLDSSDDVDVAVDAGMEFLEARTAHEILKARERKAKLAALRGGLIDRKRAMQLVHRLAREERDAWVSWPSQVAGLIAAELSETCSAAEGRVVRVEATDVQLVLEARVRDHLSSLAEVHVRV